MGATAYINHEVFTDIEKSLLTFAAINRAPAVIKGMRAAVNVVAKRTRDKIPRGNREGSKQGKPHLKDSVGVSVYQDDVTGGVTGRVKWNRKKGGYHGHLVEKGHKLVRGGTLKGPKTSRRNTNRNIDRSRAGKGQVAGEVKGKLYLAQSWEETQQEQMTQLEIGVKKALTGGK